MGVTPTRFSYQLRFSPPAQILKSFGEVPTNLDELRRFDAANLRRVVAASASIAVAQAAFDAATSQYPRDRLRLRKGGEGHPGHAPT